MKRLYTKFILAISASLLFCTILIVWLYNGPVYQFKLNYIYERLEPALEEITEQINQAASEHRMDLLLQLEEKHEVTIQLYDMDEYSAMEMMPDAYEVSEVDIKIDYSQGPYSNVILADKTALLSIGPFTQYAWLYFAEFFIYALLVLMMLSITLYLLVNNLKSRVEASSKVLQDLIDNKPIIQLYDNTSDMIGNLNHMVNQTAQKVLNKISEREQNVLNQRDLLHGVAHEFRSPMSRINFANKMLSERLSEKDNIQLSNDIDKALVELDMLVKEVLDYARIQYPKFLLKPTKIILFNMLEQIVDALETFRPEIKIQLDVDKSLNLEADEHLFYRVLINIIRNAKRFAEQQIEISCWRDQDAIIISFDDDGPGVPPGKRDRVFEAFTRLDQSRTRESGGVGLGLAIANQIIKKHQAKISIEDGRLGGANFVIRMPLNQ